MIGMLPCADEQYLRLAVYGSRSDGAGLSNEAQIYPSSATR